MPEEMVTFSLRLPQKEYDTLKSLAALNRVSIAELAREYLLSAIVKQLDPDELAKEVEKEKQRLLDAARAIRERRERGEF